MTTRLRALLAEKGLRDGDYAPFYWTGEGIKMPNGEEEASGYVLTRQGQCYFAWLGWHRQRHEPHLMLWKQRSIQRDWWTSDEFRRAAHAVSVTTTEA